MTDIFGQTLNLNYVLLLPEIVLLISSVLVIGIDAFKRQLNISGNAPVGLALAGLVVALALSILQANMDEDFARLIQVDSFTSFFRILFIAITLVLMVGSHEYIEKSVSHIGEFYGLLLLATVGAMLMASARELLTAYLAIELLSFSLYIAVSLARSDQRSGEASLKYVLLGGVASASLLYGLSMIYGVTGATQYHEISAVLSAGDMGLTTPLLLGLVLI